MVFAEWHVLGHIASGSSHLRYHNGSPSVEGAEFAGFCFLRAAFHLLGKHGESSSYVHVDANSGEGNVDPD